MALVLHTGFGDQIEKISSAFSDTEFVQFKKEPVDEKQLHDADLVLVGPLDPDPIRVIQNVSRHDKLVSVYILSEKNNFASVKKTLLFSPFVSRHASCLPFENGVAEELQRASQLTGQRRKFARTNTRINIEKTARPAAVHLENLGNFLDQAPIGTLLLNKQFEVLALNKHSRRIFNLQPFEQVKGLTDLFDETAVTTIQHYLEAPTAVSMVEVATKEEFYEVTVADVVNDVGEPLDLLLVNNITERKMEDRRIRSVLDALPQMAWTTNAFGEVTYLTQGWYQFTGQNVSQALGDGWKKVLHPEEAESFIGSWENAVVKGEKFETEARYRRADGLYRWHLVRGIPIRNGRKTLYWLGTCTDIHDQKTVEHGLENEVQQRTGELLLANEKLKKSNTDLEQFAYIASHDLKEPLRKIKTFIDLFVDAKDPSQQTVYRDKIKDAAERMSALIAGILEYSRLRKYENPELVDLNETFLNARKDLDVVIREKNASVYSTTLPSVKGSAIQLGQLFNNLIGNSLKYCEKIPEISVTAEIVKGTDDEGGELVPQKDYAKLLFSDNGIGFEQKYADQVFTIFKRLHGRDKYAGSGIGLAMCEKIVKNHQGYITVKSEPDIGSTFIVYLPLDH